MSQSISKRLTPTRERLLESFKKRFNLDKNSEAIELALKMGFKGKKDYRSKIEKVAGCVQLEDGEDSIKRIRSLRGE